MIRIWYLLYNFIVLPILFLAFNLLSLFNAKIRRGIRARNILFESLNEKLSPLNRSKKTVWFHSASMGEFEQAKPIIEKLKNENDINIVVTFFSPSGYENSLKYPYADIISYIPFDTPSLTKKFVETVKPDLAVFMRYDIWPNVILQLKKKNIPSFIVDATMRKNSIRMWPLIRGFHKSLYSYFAKILTVSEEDAENFRSFGINGDRVRAVGDTRFDRVYQKSLQAKDRKLFSNGFFNNKKVFVFGSSWESDEEVVNPAITKILEYDNDVVLIIVPHEPTEIRLEKLEHTFLNKFSTIRFSYLNNYKGQRIILIDSIGILLTLYYYADVAYVGGSFKQGIHNVLEPAVYGIPVLFGPKNENSQEAQILVEKGGAFVVNNKKEAFRKLRSLLSNEQNRTSSGKVSYGYVQENVGATKKIIEEIKRFV